MLSKSTDARTSLRLELQTKAQSGFAKITKYKKIKDRLLPTLKVSPAACNLHKSRQYSIIIDLSLRLHVNGKYQWITTQ